MVIRYPNGKLYESAPKIEKKKESAKSQSVAKEKNKRAVNYSNRGKSLEDDLNETNMFYLHRNMANIHKKPVPIQIVKVDYPARSAAVIKEAYFRTPSTTDYNGVWNGYYIDFEAKETDSKTSFPLKNIHPHQMDHMHSVTNQRGVAFFIVRFSTLNRNFVISYHAVAKWFSAMDEGGRKSIPIAVFEQDAIEISEGYLPRLDYLQAVKKLIANNNVCESEEKHRDGK
ncbi:MULTISPECIES: Holliday junction resolvase RecU [Solibacillus]|uniref:Holliday junction resolvase RecU n=1 Tax=Solibacillus TaxID=648800 RepID=UPI00203ADE29|nr:Holliday junction resolvase RecU [Solibacillus isronensis]MCM3721873.1 Holliday junction resolvase RecU [Solibacillus isronensis]